MKQEYTMLNDERIERLRFVIEMSNLTLGEFCKRVGLSMGQLNGLLYNNVKFRRAHAEMVVSGINESEDISCNDVSLEWLMDGNDECDDDDEPEEVEGYVAKGDHEKNDDYTEVGPMSWEEARDTAKVIDDSRLSFIEKLAAIGKENKCAKIVSDGITIEFYMETTQFELKPPQTKEYEDEVLFRSAG